MNSNYDKIKDYLSQKGYEGAALDKAATKATVQIEALKVGIDPSKPVDVSSGTMEGVGLDRGMTVHKHGDDYYNDESDDPELCDDCGGEGWIMLSDAGPSVWGEDCFCDADRPITCPACNGHGVRK